MSAALTGGMRNLISLSLILSACATGGLPSTAEPTGPRAHVQLDFAAADRDDVEPVRPVVLDPKVPSVDRLATQLKYELGDTCGATLRLCVAPSGHVNSATITKSSTSPDFDAALLHDIASWQFAQMPGPANVQSCRIATVLYRHG